MEDDSFAFFIFSGFVAASTVVTWAIVTYISRERNYKDVAKQLPQDDHSWMESDSPQASPVKSKTKKSAKNAAKQAQKSKVEVVQEEAPSYINEGLIEENVTIQSFKPPTEVKQKTPKKKKETSKSSAAVSKVVENVQPKIIADVRLFAQPEEELSEGEWQAVPTKVSKSTSGPKSKESETVSVGIESKTEGRGQKTGIPGKQTQATEKKLAPVETIAAKSDRNLSKFHEAPRVQVSHQSNLPHGEGSPQSENLEHSDSTEEFTESHSNVMLTAENPRSLKNQPKPIPVKINSAAAKQVSSRVSASSRKPEPLPGSSATVTSRVKRNSERSNASVGSKASKKENASTDVPAEVQKLEDELKHERNHSQDLISKYLLLNEQLEKEKQMIGSINEELQRKIQECASLRSQLSVAASAQIVAVPDESQLVIEMKKKDHQYGVLHQEKMFLQTELERARSSSNDVRREHQMKLQAAESQLKKIESRNNELQDQCNKYETQLKSAVNNSNNQANFEEKENRLLYQISGLDEKVKAMARENDVLRQNHEGTYAEMSRLQDSKIALRKENDSLREEVENLQQTVLSISQQQQQNGLDSSHPHQNGSLSSSTSTPDASNGEAMSAGHSPGAAYDWSQANSDMKQLTQLQASISSLSEENSTLRKENEELKKQVHSMNIDPNGSSSPVGHNGFSVDSDPDSSGDTLANGSSIRGKAEIRATIGADSISPSEVGTRLKDTLMRLYPEEYASKQPIAFQSNDWVTLVALLETQATARVEALQQKENGLEEEVEVLKRDLYQLSSEKEDLQSRSTKYQTALAATEASVTKLDLALTTMETEYKEKLRCLSEENELLRHDTDKVVDLQMELDQLQIENAKMKQHQGELEQKVTALNHDLQSQNCSSDEQVNKLKEEKDSLMASQEEVKKKLEAENETLLNEKNKLQSELSSKCGTSEEQIQNLKTDYENIRANQQSAHEKIISDLNAKFDSDNTNLQNQIKEKNAIIDNLNGEKANLINQINEKNGIIDHLNNEVGNINHQINEKNGIIDHLNSEVANLKSQIDEKNGILDNLNNESGSVKNQVNEKNGIIDHLNGELTSLNNQVNEKNGAIDHLNGEIGNIRNEINDKNGIIDHLNGEVSNLKNEINEKNRIIDDLNGEVGNLKHQMGEKDGELHRTKDSENNLKNQTEEANRRISELESQINGSNNETGAKSEEIAKLQQANEELQNRAKTLEVEKSDLEQQLQKLSGQISEKETHINTLNGEKDALQKSLENQKAELEKVINDSKQLTSKIQQTEYLLQVESLNSASEKARLSSESSETIQKLYEEHESTEKKLAELQQQMTESSNNLQAEKKTLEENISQLKSEAAGLQQKLDASALSLAETTSQLDATKEELAKAREQGANTSLTSDKLDTQSVTSSSSGKEHKDKEKKKGLGSFLKKSKNKDES